MRACARACVCVCVCVCVCACVCVQCAFGCLYLHINVCVHAYACEYNYCRCASLCLFTHTYCLHTRTGTCTHATHTHTHTHKHQTCQPSRFWRDSPGFFYQMSRVPLNHGMSRFLRSRIFFLRAQFVTLPRCPDVNANHPMERNCGNSVQFLAKMNCIVSMTE